MTAPNTGAPNANAPNNEAPRRELSDAERANLPAHMGGLTTQDRVTALEQKYGGRFESTHTLDRSTITAALVLADGTRIAATGASMAEAVNALTARFDKIGGAFTNA